MPEQCLIISFVMFIGLSLIVCRYFFKYIFLCYLFMFEKLLFLVIFNFFLYSLSFRSCVLIYFLKF